MQALQVTLFSDGRPGHEKQSAGVVNALKAYLDAEVKKVIVNSRPPMANLVSHLSYLFHLGKGDQHAVESNSDLIVGSGSTTHIPMLRAGRKTKAKIVTCMTPAAHLINHFDLCCVPIHDQVKPADNIFFTLGAPNSVKGSAEHDGNRCLVLIGGEDKRSHIWDEERLVTDICALLEKANGRTWLVASSPRTPGSTEALISKKLGPFQNVTFVPYSSTGHGWVEEQYRTHDSVWITADSISMVYEALSAGCRVGILPVNWRKKDNKFKRSLQYLTEQSRVISIDEYLQGDAQWLKHQPLNEADRCAREILQRWWPKSIQ